MFIRKGLFNTLVNKLPFELHVPNYNFCGPSTHLSKRLARGDKGVNPLDEACREHDIAYSQNRENLPKRHEADKVLAKRAAERIFAKDSSLGERAVAVGVVGAMKIKQKLGMGLSTRNINNNNNNKEKMT